MEFWGDSLTITTRWLVTNQDQLVTCFTEASGYSGQYLRVQVRDCSAAEVALKYRLPSGKPAWLAGISPFLIGSIHLQSGSIFQPAMLDDREGIWSLSGKWRICWYHASMKQRYTVTKNDSLFPYEITSAMAQNVFVEGRTPKKLDCLTSLPIIQLLWPL